MNAARDIRAEYEELLTAYLRGVSWNRWPDSHSGTVAAIADAFAARDPRRRPDGEAIVLLGPVHATFVNHHLRETARTSPAELANAVDSPFSVFALAEDDPALLAELARRYYIDPDGPTRYYAEDGVRDHTLHPVVRRRRRDRGPFFRLLLRADEHGLALVRDVLRVGATVRQRRMAGYEPIVDHPVERHTRQPVTLDLRGDGPREFVGDAQAWYWYRGSGVGPDACISAALTLDAWALRRVAGGESAVAVARSIMDGATTLAEAGVAYGLLLRHRPGTDAELVGWQHERLISELEIARGQREHDADNDGGVEDQEWRTIPPNQLIIDLVGRALRDRDHEQLQRLEAAGDRLAANNTSEQGHLKPEIAHSARLFKAGNYDVGVDDDTVYLVPRPDPDIAAALSPSNDALNLTMRSFGLYERFSPITERGGMLMPTTHLVRARDNVTPISRLRTEDSAEFARTFRNDLDLAHRLSESALPSDFAVFGPGPQCAVAAFVLAAEGLDTGADPLVTGDDQAWAVSTLLAGASHPEVFEDYNTLDERAATRSAARALPVAFAAGRHADRDAEIVAALKTLAGHPAREVRRTLVTGLGEVWEAPCRVTASGLCIHAEALDVVTTLIADAVNPQAPTDRPATVDSTEELAGLDKSTLDCGTVAAAAAAAVDARTASPAWSCGSGPAAEAAATDLVEAVLAMAEADRSERGAYALLAAAALRADSVTGVLEMVGEITRRLVPTGRLAIWGPAIFAAADREPKPAGLLGTGWPAMALEVLKLVPVSSPSPGENQERVELIAVAALFPAANAARPTAEELSAFLPEWVARGVNNEHVINAYSVWASHHGVSAADALNTLETLVPDLSAPPTGLSEIATIIGHIAGATLTDEQQRRLHVLVDALVAAGYSRLRRFQTEQT